MNGWYCRKITHSKVTISAVCICLYVYAYMCISEFICVLRVFVELLDAPFQPKLKPNLKKSTTKQINKSLYFRKMELSEIIKKFLIFFQKKSFLIFREMETKLSYISVSSFLNSRTIFIVWELQLSGPRKLNKTFFIPKKVSKIFLYS